VANYREIVTKAVVGKGRKTFSNKYVLKPSEVPTTILGCWVINHNFSGHKSGDKIIVDGSCDINIWYSFDNDTQTIVAKETINYSEVLSITRRNIDNISNDEEIIVRSLRQPTCVNVNIIDDQIEYEIEKELGIELVGDTKVRIAIDDGEDEWEELYDLPDEKQLEETIEQEVNEEFLSDE